MGIYLTDSDIQNITESIERTPETYKVALLVTASLLLFYVLSCTGL